MEPRATRTRLPPAPKFETRFCRSKPRTHPPSFSRRCLHQDRGTRLPIPTVERKHLPPPPVGETMGHGLSPPRDRGLGASASRSTIGAGNGAGGPSPPDGHPARQHKDEHSSAKYAAEPWASPAAAASRGVGNGRKRKSGGGGAAAAGSTRTTLRKGAPLGKEFPALLTSQSQQQMLITSSPPAEVGDVQQAQGGGGGGGGGRKGRKRRGSALRMGWINSRRSQGTLQELLRTT